MKQPIVTVENSVLRMKCTDCALDESVKPLIQDLKDTLAAKETGVGLSACQIGVPVKLFIVKYDNFSEVFINPTITKYSGVRNKKSEGCLSIPGRFVDVERYDKCSITYYNEKFELVQKKYKDWITRIVQHEYDHTQGKLIID